MPNKPKMHDVICLKCSSPFKTSSQNISRGHGKYCSAICRKTRSKETYTCSFCSIEFISIKSRKTKTKTNHLFCSNDCKYKAASSLSSSYSTGPMPKEIGLNTYRNRALIMLKNECIRCGYHEHVELLDVDHIDSNRQNNDISNLQVLCIMCHGIKTRLPHLY